MSSSWRISRKVQAELSSLVGAPEAWAGMPRFLVQGTPASVDLRTERDGCRADREQHEGGIKGWIKDSRPL